MKRQFLIYGIALALLALLLNMINYYYFVRLFSTELYIAVIALLFTGVGIWAGRKLTSPPTSPDEFHQNIKALEYLGISEREMDVLKLISEGYSNKQIANQLYISVNTVKTHVSNLLSKLDANRRTQAIKKAKSLRLIL